MQTLTKSESYSVSSTRDICSKPRLYAMHSCTSLGRMNQPLLRPKRLLRIASGRRSLACEAMCQVAARTGVPGPLSHHEQHWHLGAITCAGARVLYTDSGHYTQ